MAAFDAGHLRAFIERIEKLEEEKRGISEDIGDVYGEAKGQASTPKFSARLSPFAAWIRASAKRKRISSSFICPPSAWLSGAGSPRTRDSSQAKPAQRTNR